MTSRSWYFASEHEPKRWWRREAYIAPGYPRPLWHLLAGLKGSGLSDGRTVTDTLVAACGYEHKFVLETARTQDQVKNDKIKCQKCRRADENRHSDETARSDVMRP